MRRYFLPENIDNQPQRQEQVQDMPQLPPYFSISTTSFPSSKNVTNIPIGISISPNGPPNIPVIDYTNRYHVRCNFCHGYLSYLCKIHNSKVWRCPLCGTDSSLPHGFTPDSPEIHYPVYDVILPKYNKTEAPFKKIFTIAIDTSNYDHAKVFVNSLKNIIQKMSDDTCLYLITYNQSITLYDPSKKRKIVFSELENLPIPPINVPPLRETRPFYNSIFESFTSQPQPPTSKASKIKLLFTFVNELIGDNGCVLCAFVDGCPTDILQRQQPTFSYPDNEDEFRDLCFKLNLNNISVHIFTNASNERNNESSITSISSGLTSGTFHIIANLNIFNIELENVLTQKYYWKSCGKLRCSHKIEVTEHLGNCVIHNSGASSFGAFPQNGGITYILKLPDKSIQDQYVYFQFAMLYRNDEGTELVRIFTYPVKVSNDISTSNSIWTIGLKKAANILLTNDIKNSKRYVNSLIPNLTNINNIRMFGNDISFDQKISDIVFIRGARPIDIILYIFPREETSEICKFCQNYEAVFIITDNEENENKVIESIYGGEVMEKVPKLQNEYNESFHKFYDAAKSISGVGLIPVVFVSNK
ncbi:Sec23/Sec24 trunk domain containing protein [Histomonas meleagridis]|uniref:Sec23/Sec24 trunk domain containing protein n=1 Tax=Histomonas meleagridis TaxID=135588 RepID=UPI003559FC31|nr:Sec23/Sec24 trunk domain containing protein [Histomonas meleagridis]KAH0798416.1 Sec23/Sec24 trunk domain containing protein [Histomonas meleagridis]